MVTRGDHSDEVTSVVFLVAKPRQLPWWVPGGTRRKAIERCQLRNGWCTNGDTRQETDIQIVYLLQHQILRMLTTHEQQNFHWQSSNINKNHTCRFIITAQGEHRVNWCQNYKRTFSVLVKRQAKETKIMSDFFIALYQRLKIVMWC